jgi:aspartyl-tRNA synthetase
MIQRLFNVPIAVRNKKQGVKKMIQSRTHNCNELRLSDAGKNVTIVGWYENIRKVSKNLGFLILRDFYGTTQVVIETEEMMQVIDSVNKESTISVTGVVRERSSKNKDLATGEIEVVPEKIEILGKCIYNALPFEINQSKDADENTRLKYRYLDLRNPAVKGNIVLRSKIVAELRQKMNSLNFMEITTPILTCSSPEGARDYLVPARNHPGKFYALPQAPQQFKQILMASGFDRYFQIAPCFRDEDARADRSPGEFYQLDMEMAFASQEDVFSVVEEVLPPVFEKYGVYKTASKAPFVRIPYLESMDKYGSDKPDLRFGMELKDISEVVKGCGFGVFTGALENGGSVRGINAKGQGAMPRKKIDALVDFAKGYGAKGLAYIAIHEDGSYKSSFAKFMTEDQMNALVKAMDGEAGDLLLFAADRNKIVWNVLGALRVELADQMGLLDKNDYKFLWVTEFPLLEWSDEENRFLAMHHPFTMPMEEDWAALDLNRGRQFW